MPNANDSLLTAMVTTGHTTTTSSPHSDANITDNPLPDTILVTPQDMSTDAATNTQQ